MGELVRFDNNKLLARGKSTGAKFISSYVSTALRLFKEAWGEENSNPTEAMRLYKQAVELNPLYAEAHTNLGTLYYNRQDYFSAEKHYRKAIEADENYALAHFDLANVLDELGRVGEAIAEYELALKLYPLYADAHYNLALAYERIGERRLALRHWGEYARLDRSGPYCECAKDRIRFIIDQERLKIVRRNPCCKNSTGEGTMAEQLNLFDEGIWEKKNVMAAKFSIIRGSRS